jgi:hypothetical protein
MTLSFRRTRSRHERDVVVARRAAKRRRQRRLANLAREERAARCDRARQLAHDYHVAACCLNNAGMRCVIHPRCVLCRGGAVTQADRDRAWMTAMAARLRGKKT